MNKKTLPLLSFAISFLINAPAFAEDKPEFIDNNDGTITHTTTGLIWQKCTVGQKAKATTDFDGLTNYTCSGNAERYRYAADAMKLTSNFLGQTDWRVPNIRELNSLVNFDKVNPAIKTTLFPNISTSNFYTFWSSSISAHYYANHWWLSFNAGELSSNGRGDNNDSFVRLVRGGQSSSFFSLDTPTTDFVNNKDGTVTHTKTGLTWQRCSVGQTWVAEDGACSGSATKLSQVEAQKLTSDFAGNTDWRLPTAKELETITDYTVSEPAINQMVFPDAPSKEFWTGTSFAGDNTKGWYVNFSYGWRSYTSATSKYAVRFVRGAANSTTSPVVSTPTTPKTPQSKADLTSSITANQSSISLAQNLTYTASISNNGTGTANNVSVLFMMPPRWTNYVSVPSDCTTNGAVTTCSIGSVNAGASVSRSITVNFSRRGATSVGALVKSNDDTNDSNNMSRVVTTITK